ncbi:alcohol dehydrogenase [Acinetobacter junii]|jgi:alcohol dehydrogenase|uniref:Iron-containing alcohol dehydrogenase n=4 Tax=Gammaproteobacteria TaxID=1236 RepID=A0A2R4UMJ1_ACIJU|nr:MULTISPECIES: iron-containing alcohol dehydrogenase [Acinetobacter]MBQ1495554.1 iron-containing alcohol dehydrogenase [Acinetobacter sp.]MBY3627049.1 iron-containing alcohol dehydrogenase [Acinetobacter sp. CUI P1]APU49476.1 alcohol dehydrogenase [Acinetobacter junii]ATU46064.1 alcohol dehydrogenase [Acinetobacter junii]AWA47267.1 iron-containing alcohol dehydrogenase [Acinetobacter junii]|eukprot:TRINITY_DN1397_c0_g1_i1.p1 TRINITY_DN1397_c0_g1~~TRINITY_DN1397_c0_g1_i1.p1  ORF type:complete len:395 (-),score=66.23 TRINITY_DN1397_c0_g1_i1:341-1525(-)
MAKPYYEFFCPVKVIAGNAALEHIPFELATLGAKRPMIITDKGVRANGLLNPIEAAFSTTDAVIGAIFDDVPPDSSLEVVRLAAELYRKQKCDAIIAIGGGSVIDTSKATNILVSEGGNDLLQYSGAHNLSKPLKPFFVIPTTSGTGSEVTMVAVVSDLEKNVKIPFTSYYLMPHAAILDPRMTQTLPPHLTAMTAMDAMTHAVEAYTCLAANPLSDAYASAAIKKISENLFKVLDNPSEPQGRLELAQASTMAGIAFSNSMVGLVHSLGHALGAVAHLPHGLCMNLFLPYVLEYNKEVNGNKIGELLLPLAGADIYAQTPANQRADKAIATILTMRDRLFSLTKLPRNLRETGKVTEAQLDDVAEKALNDGSIIFNPKEASLKDLRAILQKAW